MVSFPYYSHIFMDSYGSGMGIIWETSHKGIPLLGVPENHTDNTTTTKNTTTKTPPQHHKNHHNTTKTPPKKHHHTNITTKTPPHHHKNTTTPPQKYHHQKHIHNTTTKNTTTPPPPQKHHHTTTKTPRLLESVEKAHLTTVLSVRHARSDEWVARRAQNFAFYDSFERPTRTE